MVKNNFDHLINSIEPNKAKIIKGKFVDLIKEFESLEKQLEDKQKSIRNDANVALLSKNQKQMNEISKAHQQGFVMMKK